MRILGDSNKVTFQEKQQTFKEEMQRIKQKMKWKKKSCLSGCWNKLTSFEESKNEKNRKKDKPKNEELK